MALLKRYLWVVLLTGVIIGGLFALKLHQLGEMQANFKMPPPPVVAVAKVREERWPVTISAVGSLRAAQGVSVTGEVNGMVKAIHFQSGQRARKGQLLLEMDDATDQAELAALKAELAIAELRFKRSQQLVKDKFVSQADFDQNQAQLAQARANVKAKQTMIDKKQIKAPFSGRLGIRRVDLGQYLNPGESIVNLEQVAPIYLDFAMPEQHLADLASGQTVIARFQAYPDEVFTGVIEAIDPRIDADTRQALIRARLANAKERLRPGMFAEVTVVAGRELSVLTVPDTAITYNPYGDSVFIVNDTEQGLMVKTRQVETGENRQGRVHITKGIAANERVVSAGQIKLRGGMLIQPDDRPAPGEREPE